MWSSGHIGFKTEIQRVRNWKPVITLEDERIMRERERGSPVGRALSISHFRIPEGLVVSYIKKSRFGSEVRIVH